MTQFFSEKLNQLPANMFVILVLALLACLPIFVFGIPNSSDMAQHYQFAVTFYDSVKDGIWYPSLAHLTNTGYGDVGVRFYPPFSYYVLIFFRAVAGEWFYASCAAFCFWFFAGGVGIYLWAKEWFSNRASLFAAAVYIFVPYRINELYNSFLYAEFAASAMLTFCFLFATRLCRRGKTSDLIGLAVFYALLILSNLPMALIGSISLFIYALASLDRKIFFNRLFKLGASVTLALLASSFYWIKLLLEMNFLKHNTDQYTLGRYDFHLNLAFSYFFVSADDLAMQNLLYLDIFMLLTLGVFVPAIVIFYRRKNTEDAPALRNVLVLFVFSVFITTILSEKIWENFSLLQKIQFPWRWLSVTSMCGVIFNAAVFEDLLKYFRTEKRWVVFLSGGLIFAALFFSAYKIMRPVDQYSRADFNPLIERLRTAGSYECWLPIWVDKDELKAQASTTVRRAEIVSNRQTEKILRFPAGEAADAPVKMFYFPHWQAFANNEQIEVGKAASGTVLLKIPPEETVVKLQFVEPAYIKTAEYVSAFSWFGLFGLTAFFLFARRKKLV